MSVSVRLLGGFAVEVDDAPLASAAWSSSACRRVGQAAGARAQAVGCTATRSSTRCGQGISVDAGRAATAQGSALRPSGRSVTPTSAVVLRSETVALLPDQDVHVDAVAFREAAEEALRTGRPEAAEQAVAAYAGELLPDDLYESWVEETSRRCSRLLHRDLLRLARSSGSDLHA